MIALLESAIVENFQKGHPKAFNQVFSQYYQQVYYFCNKLIGSPSDADEIASETFSKLFERHRHFATENNIRAFLYLTARNACFNYLRDHKHQRFSHEPLEDQFQELADTQQVKSEVLSTVYHHIRRLPERCKQVFELLYFEDLTPAEVASKLGITVDTVYSQKRYAIRILRLALASVFLFFYLIRWLSKD